MNNDGRKKLVILGGGFAGFRLAMGLSSKYYEVTLISQRDHFLFTPLLASTAVGTTEFRSIIEPLSAAGKGTVIIASCESIDFEKKSVHCFRSDINSRFEVEFDKLVFAVGATHETFGVPGVEENALYLKELSDARKVRQEVVKRVQQAMIPNLTEAEKRKLLHFIIVGGGPTGVEFAGELHDFLHDDLIPRFPEISNLVTLTLLEAGPRLLSGFHENLSRYAMRSFTKRSIQVQIESPVTKITESQVFLKDGKIINFGLIIWSGGVSVPKLIKDLPFEKGPISRIIVDGYLKILNQENIYALGDCAYVQGREYPMTAQCAQQAGKYLASALNAEARGKKYKPFRYLHLGMLTSLGGHRAVADTPGIRWRGFVAWILWRSIYLTKLVSFKNKVRVLFDWFKATLFGRDITTF